MGIVLRLWDLGTLLQEGGRKGCSPPSWLQVLCVEQRCFRWRCCLYCNALQSEHVGIHDVREPETSNQ